MTIKFSKEIGDWLFPSVDWGEERNQLSSQTWWYKVGPEGLGAWHRLGLNSKTVQKRKEGGNHRGRGKREKRKWRKRGGRKKGRKGRKGKGRREGETEGRRETQFLYILEDKHHLVCSQLHKIGKAENHSMHPQGKERRPHWITDCEEETRKLAVTPTTLSSWWSPTPPRERNTSTVAVKKVTVSNLVGQLSEWMAQARELLVLAKTELDFHFDQEPQGILPGIHISWLPKQLHIQDTAYFWCC